MDLKVITACVLLMIPLSEASCQICGGQYPNLQAELSQVREEAVQWLADQQNVYGSWPNLNTQNAILGLQLANQGWLASQGLGERLLTKSRLEYELLIQLLPVNCCSLGNCNGNSDDDESCHGGSCGDSSSSSSDDDDDDSDDDDDDDDSESTSNSLCCPSTFERGAGILAQYMLSLQSVCCLADNFYGFDLKCTMTNLLEDCLEDNSLNFFEYSLAILSMCSCDADIFKEALEKLADGSDETDPCFSPFGDDSGHNIDILSMQVMAMVCARDQAIDKNVANWDSILAARIQCILEGQNADDGSFGNAITTALAIQALTAANTDPTIWSCNEAITWLLSQQTDGNFGGVGATAQIIPFLDCNNFGSLQNIMIECPEYDEPPMPPPIMPGDPTVTFDIKVEVDGEITAYSATILMGESLYFGMLRLADTDPDFTFTTSDSSFGQFIVSINGLASDADASLFWIIYILVDGELTFAPTGIEGLFPVEGECFQFGYTDFSK
ncbi:hypothetical protein HOLleu_15924 [Holothuria leucospilota]|uniref:Uncharacterized protein n=1 Tax=Holothuria leucospilota TaxID=206669 RepID=A0A9Q1H7G3_HOLLE|nr:hypothetical protein HOLleu_15924 [Holothuria leucospilota]